MATTFLKRQKEMKRLEKQREKSERRKQKKLAKRDGIGEAIDSAENDSLVSDADATSDAHSHE